MEFLFHSRRSFLKNSLFAGLSLLTPEIICGRNQSINWPTGVCTSISNAEILRRSGCDYLEESVTRFLIPDKPDKDFQSNLESALKCRLPLPVFNIFIPGTIKSVGPQADHKAIFQWAEISFQRAKILSGSLIVFGSGVSRRIPDGFNKEKAKEQFISLLRQLGVIAEKYNIYLALEPLNYNETNLLNTIEEGIDYVHSVGHTHIQLLADVYHMLKNGEPPESLLNASGLVRHVHIAEKEKRTPPGTAGDDFRPFFSALKKIYYAGRISIECQWANMDSELPKASAELKKQIAEA